MKLSKILLASAATIAFAAPVTAVLTPAVAQQTTSAIRGVVTDEAGAPLAGATVSIVDTRTGTSRTVTTDGAGRFGAQNLSVAGLYNVTVTSGGFQGEAVEGVRLSLADTTQLAFTLARVGAGATDEIIVIATRSATVDVAMGPNSTFDFEDLQTTPAISRDIKEILRTDPRIFIDESFGNGVQCAGASPRFNSLTVDGIKLNDNFGLNSNGYPTERLPFPFDAINQVAVELAPFDVEYGGFTGCNINAVTRSGTNEFHGGAWFDYTNDSLNGGSIDGSSFDKGEYSDFRFGATLGGPIIKDKLFFFAAYEKINETEVFGRGPAEAGATGVQGVSQAQLDRIAAAAQNIYGYAPTPLPASAGEDDEKILVRLDWNVNDMHRAAFTFNRIDGFNITPSDSDPDEYEFFDHYYVRGTTLTSYAGQFFSDWTDNLSTEVRVSFTKNDTIQESNDKTSFGEVQIRTFNDGQLATVYLGGDDSRQANKLDTETFNLKLKADYQWNNQLFTFGYEQEQVEIFNLFIQHTQGEYRFDRLGFTQLLSNPDGNIEDFEIQLADDIFYGNAGGTNNQDDGAANFSFTTHTFYAQDEVTFDDIGFSFTAGLRFDLYSSGDTPAANPNFLARNGFDNTSTFDGKSLLQPRFGFNWQASDNLTIRGGGGLFSGGNPNVWLSNSYQNDGITTVQTSLRDQDMTALTFVNDDEGLGRPIWGVPQTLFDQVGSGSSNTGVNAIDPNFDIPSQWKAALGATYTFWDDASLLLDFIYTDDKDAAGIIDATLEQVDTAPDGRPIYRSIDRADPDCVVPTAAACGNRNFNQDFILVNNDGGKQKIFSAALNKGYDFDSGLRANWTLAYAYSDTQDRNPMTSSVAFSNFVNFATSDPNNPGLGTSNYEVPHRFTLRASVSYPFFGDYETRISLFGQASQSRPYSFVFEDAGDLFGDTLDGRHLLYVPTGANDPNVIFAPGFDTTGFFAKLDELGLSEYAGGIAPRNGFQSDWYSQWDLRFEQELPGVFGRAKAFVVIDNIGNLLNDKWGVINQAGFPGSVELVEIDESGLGPNGEYIFESFRDTTTPESLQSPLVGPSVWGIRFGMKYDF